MKMSYISHLLLALRMLCKGCYRFHRFYAFSRGRAKSIQILHASCGRVLSLKAEKRKIFFFKNILDT